MRILFTLFLAWGLLYPNASAMVRNIQDNYQLVYNVLDESGDHVTGQTVTLKIKRISDGYWLDFNDDTFKVAGWTSKCL